MAGATVHTDCPLTSFYIVLHCRAWNSLNGHVIYDVACVVGGHCRLMTRYDGLRQSWVIFCRMPLKIKFGAFIKL